jgi:hypothetical protein
VLKVPQDSAVTARTSRAGSRPATPPPPTRRREETETEERRRPVPKRRPRDEQDEDDFEQEAPQRRRRAKKKSPVLMISLIVGGVLLLAGVGVGGYFLVRGLFGAGTRPAAMKFLPGDSEFIASVRVADVRASAFYQELKKQVPQLETKLQEELNKEKMSLDDITAIMIGGASGPATPTVVIQTSKAFTAEDVLAKNPGPKPTPEAVGPYQMYFTGTEAVAVPDPHTIVVGNPGQVRAVLQRNGDPEFSPGLQAALKQVDLSKPIAFAGDLKKTREAAGAAQGMAGLPGMAGTNFQAIIQGLETIGGVVDLGGEARLKAFVGFKDNAVATQAKQAADGLKGMAGLFLPPDANQAISKMEISVEGSRLVVVSSVSVATVAKGIQDALRKQAGGFQPQPFPGPPGGQPLPDPKAGGQPFPQPGQVGGVEVLRVQGQLTNTDPKDKLRKSSHHKVHLCKMEAGHTYVIDLQSTQFDTYLRLEDPRGTDLAQDDDSGGNLNARITFRPTRTGNYRVIATSFMPATGAYTLIVRKLD